MITLLAVTIISEAINNRAFVCTIQNIWYLPGLIGLIATPVITGWGFFALATAILGGPWVSTASLLSFTGLLKGGLKSMLLMLYFAGACHSSRLVL